MKKNITINLSLSGLYIESDDKIILLRSYKAKKYKHFINTLEDVVEEFQLSDKKFKLEIKIDPYLKNLLFPSLYESIVKLDLNVNNLSFERGKNKIIDLLSLNKVTSKNQFKFLKEANTPLEELPKEKIWTESVQIPPNKIEIRDESVFGDHFLEGSPGTNLVTYKQDLDQYGLPIGEPIILERKVLVEPVDSVLTIGRHEQIDLFASVPEKVEEPKPSTEKEGEVTNGFRDWGDEDFFLQLRKILIVIGKHKAATDFNKKFSTNKDFRKSFYFIQLLIKKALLENNSPFNPISLKEKTLNKYQIEDSKGYFSGYEKLHINTQDFYKYQSELDELYYTSDLKKIEKLTYYFYLSVKDLEVKDFSYLKKIFDPMKLIVSASGNKKEIQEAVNKLTNPKKLKKL